jgi:hypothetical protein
VLDTLEQPAKPLLREYLRRAKLSRGGAAVTTVFLAFETFVKPVSVDHFVPCWDVGEGMGMQRGGGWQRIKGDVGEIVGRSGGRSMYSFIPSISFLASSWQDRARGKSTLTNILTRRGFNHH